MPFPGAETALSCVSGLALAPYPILFADIAPIWECLTPACAVMTFLPLASPKRQVEPSATTRRAPRTPIRRGVRPRAAPGPPQYHQRRGGAPWGPETRPLGL